MSSFSATPKALTTSCLTPALLPLDFSSALQGVAGFQHKTLGTVSRVWRPQAPSHWCCERMSYPFNPEDREKCSYSASLEH